MGMTVKATTSTEALLDRLSRMEPTDMPVLSVYLDTRHNEVGREAFEPFLRKELRARAESYARRSLARESVETDAARILSYVRTELPPRAQSAILFSCAAAGLFESEVLEAPIGENRVYIGRQPHLYPLARLIDQYRRYATLVADTHVARIFVFGLGRELAHETIVHEKTRRTAMGGWSQMRYQRHVDHRHLKHAKEAAAALARIVREEAVEGVIVGGDEVILPLVREELPKDVTDKVIDVRHMDVRTPEHEILQSTLDVFRRRDSADDAEAVTRLYDDYRGGGLAVVGLADTMAALDAGQVDELLLSAAPIGLDRAEDPEQDTTHAAIAPDALARRETLAGDLVARARRTGASVRFIEDVNLLWDVGGMGAFLRYRLSVDGPAVPPVVLPEVDYEP
jgi:peptide chain release factor subunit 1